MPRILSRAESFTLEMVAAVTKQADIPRWGAPPQWEEVYKFADMHNITNILYYATIGVEVTPAVKVRIQERFHQAVHGLPRYETALASILKKAEASGVHLLPLKECHMPQYYPHADMCATKNLRFLVDKTQTDAVYTMMAGLGFDPRPSEFEWELVFFKLPDVMVVFQTKIPSVDKRREKYFALSVKQYPKLQKHRFVHCLREAENYLYTVATLAEDFSTGAIQLKQVLDFWCYHRAVEETIPLHAVKKQLRFLKLGTFYQVLMQLAECWFSGVLFEESDRTLTQVERYILSKGNQGREVAEKVLPLIRQVADMEVEEGPKNDELSWMLPSREYMEGMFPKLQESPGLLPYYYGVRLMRRAVNPIKRRRAEKVAQRAEQRALKKLQQHQQEIHEQVKVVAEEREIMTKEQEMIGPKKENQEKR